MGQAFSVQDIAAAALARKPAFNIPWRPALMQYAKEYSSAVAGCKLSDPCMVAAIVARESGGRNIFQEGIPRGPGCGVGLGQITAGVDWSNPSSPMFQGYHLIYPNENLYVLAHYFLEPALTKFPDNHIAAFAAYNLGAGNVAEEIAEGVSVDAWTTGGDYGHAVFTDWINFAAVSMGYDVSWSTYKSAA